MRIARIPPDEQPSGPAFALARSERELWVGSGRSGRYELDPEGGKLGTSWTLARTPDPSKLGAVSFTLLDVSASASNVVWSAGFASYQNGEGITTGPLVETWNGRRWTFMTSLPMTPNAIEVVAANDIYAVGFNGFGVVIAHWNGTRWTSVPTPAYCCPTWSNCPAGRNPRRTSARRP